LYIDWIRVRASSSILHTNTGVAALIADVGRFRSSMISEPLLGILIPVNPRLAFFKAFKTTLLFLEIFFSTLDSAETPFREIPILLVEDDEGEHERFLVVVWVVSRGD
jgi:hypothetical protein